MGHEIGSHGDYHTRPLKIDVNCFKSRMITSKKKIEDTLSVSVNGYRAPSFSLDRERLDIVREVGFIYDSSKNPFQEHPLYGKIDMSGFQKICSNVYRYNDFLEFETNAVPLMNKSIPVSGGAYIRVFPWMITKKMIRECVKYNEYYVFYIHPFEVSSSSTPYLDSDISLKTKMRFSLGRSTVENKIKKLIEFLREEGFKFLTFSEVRSMVLKNDIDINRL
jgi:peptidoglycan/xylan/chitin deacetylase (PgdA/CDA1 family)